MTYRGHTLIAAALGSLLAGGCAGNTPSPDTRSEQDCPMGQVLVCRGSDANSRVKDSRLNEKDICICEQKDRF